jgi:hypothetical protein
MNTTKSKPRTKNLPPETMQVILKCHTLILIGCALAAFYCSIHAYSGFGSYAANHVDYGLQNLGAFFIFLEAAFAYSMNSLQNSTYWLPWLRFRKAKLDERQITIRQHVYEQAFVMTIAALFTLVPIVFSMLAQYSRPAQGDLFSKFSVILGIFLISLPAGLAAWRKDS